MINLILLFVFQKGKSFFFFINRLNTGNRDRNYSKFAHTVANRFRYQQSINRNNGLQTNSTCIKIKPLQTKLFTFNVSLVLDGMLVKFLLLPTYSPFGGAKWAFCCLYVYMRIATVVNFSSHSVVFSFVVLVHLRLILANCCHSS